MPWDKESAREAGRKGGRTRVENKKAREEFLAALSPDEVQKHVLKENAFAVAQELADAALGKGKFAPHTFEYEGPEGEKRVEYIEGLSAADRLKAINIFMTFSAPKPKPEGKKDETPPQEAGFAISVEGATDASETDEETNP